MFSYCWVLRVLCKFWMIFIYQTCLLLIFSPSLWLVFSFSFVFRRAEVFNFNEIQWIGYFFHGSCLGVVSKKSLTYPRSSRLSSVLSSKSVIVLCFTFSFVIHFELIYVKGMRSVLRFSLTFSLSFFFCLCVHRCSSTISWKDCLCAIVLLCQTLCGSISGLL